jgi:hypothetical protein
MKYQLITNIQEVNGLNIYNILLSINLGQETLLTLVIFFHIDKDVLLFRTVCKNKNHFDFCRMDKQCRSRSAGT